MNRSRPPLQAALVLLLVVASSAAADPPSWVNDLSADTRADLRLVFERLDQLRGQFADGTSRFTDRVHAAWMEQSDDYPTLIRSLSDLGYSIQYDGGAGGRTQTVAASAMVRDINRLESDLLGLLADERPLPDEPGYAGAAQYLLDRLSSLGLPAEQLVDARDNIYGVVDELSGADAVSAYIEALDGAIDVPNRSSVASLRFVLRRAVDEWWWRLLTAEGRAEARELLEMHVQAAEEAAVDLSSDLRTLSAALTRAEVLEETMLGAARSLALSPDLILDSRRPSEAAALVETPVRLAFSHLRRLAVEVPLIAYLAPRVVLFWTAATPGERLLIAEAGSGSTPMLEAGAWYLQVLAEDLLVEEPAASLLAAAEADLDEYRRGLDGAEEQAALESYREAGREVVAEAKRRLAADPPGQSDRLSEALRWSLLAVLRNRYAQLRASQDSELGPVLSRFVQTLTERVVSTAAQDIAGRGTSARSPESAILPAVYPYDVVVSFASDVRPVSQAAQTAALAEGFAEETREEGARSGFAFVPLNWLREHGWTAVAFAGAAGDSLADAEDYTTILARALVVGDTVDEDLVVRAILVSRVMDDMAAAAGGGAVLVDTVPARTARAVAEAELLDRLYRCELTLAEFFRALDVVLVASGRGDLRDLLGEDASFLDAALYLVAVRRGRVEAGLAVLEAGRRAGRQGAEE